MGPGLGSFMMLIAFLPSLIAIVLAVAAIRTIWITLTPPRKGVKQPSCERCKYPVTGLASLNCPECGGDLRVVGIITRPMEVRRRGGLGGAILGLTMLVLAAYGICMLVFVELLAPSAVAVATTPMVTSTTLTPKSAAYSSMTLEQAYPGSRGGSAGASFDAALQMKLADGTTLRFEVMPDRTYSAQASDDPTASTGTLSRAAISDWFRKAGMDTSNASVSSEIDETLRMLDVTLISPYTPPQTMKLAAFTVGTTATTGGASAAPSSSMPSWEITGWIVTGGFLAFWGLCVWLIVRRRRKLLRDFADKPPVVADAAVTA